MRCSLLLFAILVFFGTACLATIFGTVRGIVHDPQHRPVPDIQVILQAKSSDYTQTTQTDSAGQFQFDTVPLGEYTISISDATFVVDQQSVTVLSGTAPILHLELNLPTQNQTVVQSHVDLFLRNFTEWQKCGMEGALFGIESFHQTF